MSFLNRCDICGKAQGRKGIKFDNRPLKLQIPNYKKLPYNIYVDVKIEDARDTRKIQEFYKNKESFLDNIKGMMGGAGVDFDESEMPQSGAATIAFENPYPIICNSCKRELIKLTLSYGDERVPVKF